MTLTFWGAAQTVTGSMHMVEANGQRVLLDCGLYQGRRKEAAERNRNLPFRAADIDTVVLSHAHIDHSGNMPTLVKHGFNGPIYTTPATIDLAHAMLADSAHLQEKDAEFLSRRSSRRRKIGVEDESEVVAPLYTMADAEAVFPLFRPVKLDAPTEVAPGASVTLIEAGHMLGSAAVVLEAANGARPLRIAFSGDVGRAGLPITKDPAPMPPVDYLIMESTYGDRLHKDMGSVSDKLAETINRTCRRGGRIVAPAFAVGRTQQLVLMLHELMNAGRIPSIPIFVDSPLAVNVTEIHRRHADLFDDETRAFLTGGEDPFGFARLRYIREVAESKALNDLRGPFLVISASGMCEAGRILHHLRNSITDPRNTVLITGFQGEHTLGRKIVDKLPEVSIFGEPMRLRAEVVKLNELSGHADQRELLLWMKPMVGTLRKVFLVHGEPGQQKALAEAIRGQYGLDVAIPQRGEVFSLQ